jgi:hypothetical protein
MISIYFFILLSLFQLKSSYVNVDLKNQTLKCVTWMKTHIFENNQLHMSRINNSILVNFNDFKQLLDIDCKNFTLETTMLLLNAEQNILIEENINLTSVLRLINFASSNKDIQIRNILGFNQYVHHTKSIYIEMSNYTLYFNGVNFVFYLNKTLITKEMCRHENFYKKQINYFWPMRTLFFDDVSYSSSPICPYVFLNAILDNLGLYQITNSFIFKNRLEFINIDADVPVGGLHTNEIQFLALNIVYEELSEKILNPHIFKYIIGLELSGSPYRIKETLFELFTQLEYVICYMESMRKFLHEGITWINSLNVNVNNNDTFELRPNSTDRLVILVLKELNLNRWTQVYTYPDEDLCLYETFPNKQLIIPSIHIAYEHLTCSCTLIWLIQNQRIFQKYKTSQIYEIYFKNLSVHEQCMNNNYLEKFEACQFTEKFNTCLNKPLPKLGFELSAIDILFVYEWVRMIIQVYLKTFLTLFGLLTNVLVLLVLKNKAFAKNFNNIMYKHIGFNSMFNFGFCLIQSFSLINLCIFPKSSFCSNIYKTSEAQYVKIVLILFLGNSLRLCCNFSFILFSVSRFCISVSTKSKLFLKFKSLHLKSFYLIMFVMCSLWSMFKLFEFRPNETFSSFETSFPYNRYDLRYCQKANDYYKFLAPGCKIFPILNVINNVFNNIIFFFISIFIDICMIRFVNRNYKHKKEMNLDAKHIEEALGQKKKIRKLVITNGILYFFSHILEFVLTILVIVFEDDLKTFCFTSFSCADILELFETFGFISMCLQFFVFNHFDHNFIESGKNLFEKFVERFKKIFKK